jgi:hypothetical protein
MTRQVCECKNCQFFLPIKTGDIYGHCYFNPPTFLPAPRINKPGDLGFFPVVMDYMWCGKFISKEKEFEDLDRRVYTIEAKDEEGNLAYQRVWASNKEEAAREALVFLRDDEKIVDVR